MSSMNYNYQIGQILITSGPATTMRSDIIINLLMDTTLSDDGYHIDTN